MGTGLIVSSPQTARSVALESDIVAFTVLTRPTHSSSPCKSFIAASSIDTSSLMFYIILCSFCANQTWETKQCHVPCSVDCQMSPWTEWGVCDAVCGYGLKNRTAKVVRLASVGGRPCPGPSVQYALCNYPCEHFQWMTSSAWSTCVLIDSSSSCGRGRKTRTIKLVVASYVVGSISCHLMIKKSF